DGQNVSIEPRFADGHYEQLPMMAADLARRRVALIFAGGGTVAAAKAATGTIPIVFSGNGDPVQSGTVASLPRPGGNLTGASNMGGDVRAKRLQLMPDLIPGANVMGYLVNSGSAGANVGSLRLAQAAAASLGLELHILEASNERDFESAFAKLAELRAGALAI